jgi:hypothetical protein
MWLALSHTGVLVVGVTSVSRGVLRVPPRALGRPWTSPFIDTRRSALSPVEAQLSAWHGSC